MTMMSFHEALDRAGLPPDRSADLARRAARHWPVVLGAFRRLYADRANMAVWERRLADRLIAAAAARPADLADLDRRREQAPDWFQAPDMVGYSFYVDRFAGTLAGLRGRVGYLRDLGIRYLHPLPLLMPRAGDSDGGFAVADFRQVDPRLGTMDDLRALAADLRAAGMSLCLDVVCNHTAAEHPWAMAARAGDPAFRDFYHVLPDRAAVEAHEAHLAQVFPQTAPGNFTHVPEMGGWVWTTFYPFQWDLNYANPAVFVEMLDILLYLANQGAEAFRLDSVPFLWKRQGTDCRGLHETHLIVRAWRALLSIAAPAVALKAEAIVGLEQVLPFFGTDGAPECHLAYDNAAMAALWAAPAEGDARPLAAVLTQAAARPAGAAWLTYLRCHDDIIWDALAGEIPADRLRRIAAFYAGEVPGPFAAQGRAFQPLGLGTRSTNGMTASLLGGDTAGTPDRIRLLYGVLLALDGIPTIYMGDELAVGNDEAYAADPDHAHDGRWLHRPVLDPALLDRRGDAGSRAGAVFAMLKDMIARRGGLPALHGRHPARPFATGRDAVLGFVRGTGADAVACIANFAGDPVHGILLPAGWTGRLRDALTGTVVDAAAPALAPWQVRWLMREG